MRIAFDGTTLRPGRTGVGYYTEHLLRHIIEEGRQHEVMVLSNRAVDLARPLPARVQVHGAAWRTPRLVWMHTMAPRILRRLQPDVVHFTNGMVPMASTVPTVVTIHDMSLTLYPKYHPPRRVMLNRPFVDLAARRADAIITVSHSAKRDIVRHYGLADDRVHVVTEAAAPEFHRIRDVAALETVRQRYGLADRFVLYVGSIEPRKNLRLLLEAFALRARRAEFPHKLVCVGPYGWLSRDIEDLIEKLGIEHLVQFTGYVPFADLPAIYNIAEMVAFPSIYEGFGLPVIEAMACGTPVITGRVAALLEVGGEAIEQIEHLHAELLGDAMVRLAQDRERRHHLSELGVVRASRYSWQRAARETLAVYEHAASAGRGVRSPSPEAVDQSEAVGGVPQAGAAMTDTSRTWGV
jgi:glycosyltransferase involved in cell wall biosynthesis